MFERAHEQVTMGLETSGWATAGLGTRSIMIDYQANI